MDKLACMTTFVRVVEAGSFATVAGATGLTAPMIGRQVRALEDHLGTQLLTRTTRRHSLTEAGRTYFERAKAVLAEVEAADESVTRMRTVPRGLLRIDAPVTFGTACLAPVLPEYLAANPEVRIDLTLNNRVVDLVEEGYDAVFRTGDLPDSGLMARALAPYRLVLCAAPAYLARRGTPSVPADLEKHACLGFHPGRASEHWELAAPDHLKARIKVLGPFSSNSGQALRAVALGGAGIIMQAEALLTDDLKAGDLVTILNEFTPRALPMHLVFSANRPPAPKLRSFIDFALERLS